MIEIPELDFTIQQGDTWIETITLYLNQQIITLSGITTTWALTYVSPSGTRTQITALAFDITPADLQLALQQIDDIGGGNISVTGAAGGPYTISFVGDLDGIAQEELIPDWTDVDGAIDVDRVPENLTTGTPSAKLIGRPHVDSPYKAVDLSSGGGSPTITMNASGELVITVPAATTATWNFDTLVYACQVTKDGVTATRFKGTLTLLASPIHAGD
jgi:hypothetical protein